MGNRYKEKVGIAVGEDPTMIKVIVDKNRKKTYPINNLSALRQIDPKLQGWITCFKRKVGIAFGAGFTKVNVTLANTRKTLSDQ